MTKVALVTAVLLGLLANTYILVKVLSLFHFLRIFGSVQPPEYFWQCFQIAVQVGLYVILIYLLFRVARPIRRNIP